MSVTDFDLAAYAQRIGHTGELVPNLATLRALVQHHSAAIPFENIDVLLQRGIPLDMASLQQKMLHDRRGGYCFEQNLLLMGALQRIGFAVEGLLARVVRGRAPDATTPRTHLVLKVDLAEGPWLADVGFGGLTPTAPIALCPDIVQQTAHEDCRLSSMGDEFLLESRIDGTWHCIYRLLTVPQFQIDYEVANWFTSTHPSSLFTGNLVVTRPSVGMRTTLFNHRLSERTLAGGLERRTVSETADYGDVLARHFGIRLSADELAAIATAMQQHAADASHPAFG